MMQLQKFGTWELVSFPTDRKVIGCKWLCSLKTHANGSIARYKSRLVSKGYAREAGADYRDTFSLVVKSTTIRTLLTLAVTKQWKLHQMDFNNTFLNGDLIEDVFMEQPLGFVQHDAAGRPLVIIGSNEEVVQKLINKMRSMFSLKDLAELSYFLGIEFQRSSRSIHLTERKYIHNLLAKTQMIGANAYASPMAVNVPLFARIVSHSLILTCIVAL
ncbi:hypothetical protein QN277_022545 [Acacia crassicarpa]|nr:hypothetical protein QN277_022545 [Acacia crassicarpa]